MEYEAKRIDWSANAGRQLDALARALPAHPKLDLTVFGSAPLQLMVDQSFLSEDIDVSSAEEHWEFLEEFVAEKGWAKGQSDCYFQICDPRAFRSTFDWRLRAIEVERHGHLFRFVHPWDVLASKLQRLEEKDVEAFKLVIAKTGHPTEHEFIGHLQKAVDLYRPKFDEETARGDMFANTRELWKILWNKEIDVRATIIRPALARSVHEEKATTADFKTRLANLKLRQSNS
jgi:hypothetical protein